MYSCDNESELDNTLKDSQVQKYQPHLDNSDFVSTEKATSIASSFIGDLKSSSGFSRSISHLSENSYSIKTIEDAQTPLMYIINYTDGGFVIVCATKDYYPILAYSDVGYFDVDDKIEGATQWLSETTQAIEKSDILNVQSQLSNHHVY